MSESGIALHSNVTILAHRFGELVWTESAKNHVGTRGRANVAQLLNGQSGLSPRYIALGTGTTAVTDQDLGLTTEVFRRKVSKVIPMDDVARFILYVYEDEANGLGTFSEIGLFSGTLYDADAPTEPLYGGRLFAKTLITPVSKDENTTLTVVWDIGVESAT